MTALVLDAGGLIAVDRLDRTVGAMLRIAQQEKMPVRTSATVVAQVWRNGSRQANLVRVLAGVDAVSFDRKTGTSVGEVLALTNTADVVDGHVGCLVQPGDIVLTGDTADINRILEARRVDATVQKV